MATITPHTTRAAGTILTAAIYNADHVNHISNAQNLNTEKLEGATPPVVDGHAVLWLGTTGAALKTAGFVPANAARLINTGTGLLGGGDLTGDRTLTPDFASQAEAEAGSSTAKVMSPGRSRQFFDHTNQKASQSEAEAGSNDTKWVSSLKLRQFLDHANQKASQAEAQAGTNNTKWMSPLRVSEAITALAQAINIGTKTSFGTTGVDTGANAAKGAIFLIGLFSAGAGTTTLDVSLNGGSGYTQMNWGAGLANVQYAVVLAAKGSSAVAILVDPSGGAQVIQVAPTGGAGNIFIKAAGVSGTSSSFTRIM